MIDKNSFDIYESRYADVLYVCKTNYHIDDIYHLDNESIVLEIVKCSLIDDDKKRTMIKYIFDYELAAGILSFCRRLGIDYD